MIGLLNISIVSLDWCGTSLRLWTTDKNIRLTFKDFEEEAKAPFIRGDTQKTLECIHLEGTA